MSDRPIPPVVEKLPFDGQWQQQLAILLLRDDDLAEALKDHVRPNYFEADLCRWIWSEALEHKKKYGRVPSELILQEKVQRLGPRIRQLYETGLRQLCQAPLTDVQYLRDTVLEWVRRNVFAEGFRKARDLYNRGTEIGQVYDVLMREMDRFEDIRLERVQEGWLYDELATREARRTDKVDRASRVGTGVAELDKMLGGGPEPGFLGLWMAYSKAGKSMWLINQGVVATLAYYQPTAHFILEGSLEQLSNRYDASLSAELYTSVCRGELGTARYASLFADYRFYRSKLYLRAFTDRWNYSVPDLHEALRRMWRLRGWRPTVLIVDYADLLRADGQHDDEFGSQAASYSQLKTLSTKDRGYIIWTAAQAKKPTARDFDLKPTLLKSSDLSGRYEKIKVADFVGSLNATLQERTEGRMRLWIEAVRDGVANREISIAADYGRMIFGDRANLRPGSNGAPPPNAPPGLGYRQLQGG